MPRPPLPRFPLRLLWVVFQYLTLMVSLQAAAPNAQGLVRTVIGSGATDRNVADNVWLYVPAGEPATPFLPQGPFSAVWTGNILAELRADFTFHIEANGPFKLTINDSVVLETAGTNTEAVASKSVRLNKGANRLMAEFNSSAASDSWVRLYWSNKETPFNPIPNAQLNHPESPELSASLALHKGRDLFTELRCGKCHTTGPGMPELSMDAPALEGIGSRRRFDWLVKWIMDPVSIRPGAHMPKVFAQENAQQNAEAIATYLASLQTGSIPQPQTADADAGRALYEKLHCAACHVPPEGGTAEPGKISQRGVRSKFTPGSIAAFLKKPSEHYAWIRMPDFRLTQEEAAQLASYLESAAEAPQERAAPTNADQIRIGKELVQTSGCLACHTLALENKFLAKSLNELPKDAWTKGCLADAPVPGQKAPVYSWNPGDTEALRAFGSTDRSSLTRSTDADFLERHSVHLQCRECHGKIEGFPIWEILPGKLKPEWAMRFIGGKEPWKPRPWLEARMPGFGAYAEYLGRGLSTLAGLPPLAEADPAPADSADQAKIGQKLAGPNGGFTCVSCHGIADYAATQVFEAPGINLAHSSARLQKSYFKRWLRSPLSVDPSTKMPVYFDEEGRSPLADVLEGDGPKTINAIWEYLRMGDRMPKPE